MKSRLYNILALVLVFGCSENSSDIKMTDLDEFKTHAIDVERKPVSIFDQIESVEILRLEETQESLLSDFYNIERLGSHFVFGDPSDGVVYVFDEQGNFLNRISERGIGPKEYSLLLNSWVEGDSIGVFDVEGIRIHKYDITGKHLASSRLPYSPAEMTFWNGKYYLDMSTSMFDNKEIFAVLILDRDMEEIGRTISLKAIKPFGVFWRSPFITYNDELTYHDTISDTIYVTDNETFRPLLSIDFGQKWAWRDQTLLMDRRKANTMLRRSSFVNKFQAMVGPQYVFVQHNWAGSRQTHLINRSTGDVKRFEMRKESKDDFSLVPFRWDGNRLLVSFRSPDVSEFIASTGSKKIKFRQGTTLEKIESSENPVLAWIKFK